MMAEEDLSDFEFGSDFPDLDECVNCDELLGDDAPVTGKGKAPAVDPEVIVVDDDEEEVTVPKPEALSRGSSQDAYESLPDESFFDIDIEDLQRSLNTADALDPPLSTTSSKTADSVTATEPVSSKDSSKSSSSRIFERTVSAPSTSTTSATTSGPAPSLTTCAKSKSFPSGSTSVGVAGSSRHRPTSALTVPQKRKSREPDSVGVPESRITRRKLPCLIYEGEPPEKPVIISHDARYKNIFDARAFPLGVQWEIARFMTIENIKNLESRSEEEFITYGSIQLQWLDSLRRRNCGNAEANAQMAPDTAQFLAENILEGAATKRDHLYSTMFAKEMMAKSPWKELDREVETLRNNPSGCLGVDVGGGEGNDGWYGGKIHFTGKMREDGHIVLQRPELGPSCRFTRKYGSASLVRIKVPQKLVGDKLREYCKRPFVILGRVFRAFYEKDLTVFLMQTDEVLSSDQNSVLIQKSDGRSISHFINWHNPIFQNREQTMAKWAARQALALSNSVPGVLFKKENIFDIPDEISEAWYEKQHTKDEKPPSEMIMTDGCGFVNRTVLNTLRKRHGWHTTPTAIQGRLAGAKGLFLVHPTDDDPEPKAWIRPSQVKIKYTEEQMSDPALRTLDVLRASHMKTPGRLSAEIIINLSHNGVRPKVFIELMAAGLEERVRALTDWEGPDGPFNVWCAVASAGNVFNARAAREAAGEARVNGYRDKDDDDADDDDDEELIDIEVAVNGRSSAWWADHISGCPSSLEETCMVLIDAGFTPDTCWVLQAKLREVIKSKIKTYVSKYNFEVFMSCTAFIVPDPVGVLEAGEIQILCSDRVMKPSDGSDELTNVIIGDVVVGRNPCKLPTDVQKVRAVQKDELREYRDVIVFSTKGDRSLASKLGGGDYDGDKVLAIWQPEITNSFQNADPKFLDPAAEVKEWISKDPTTVSDILEGSTRTSLDHFIRGQQDFLLMGLRTLPLVGIYSTMHDYAAYMKGYDAEETVALAHMSCIVLDGTKTGLTVKSEVYARHENLYRKGKRAPFWREEQKKDTEKEKLIPANEAHPKRPEALQNFVMDRILDASRQERDKWLRYLDEHMPEPAFTDKDLEEPLRDARRRAQNRMEKGCHDLHDDLQLIEHHVERIWRERPTRGNSEKSGNKEGGASFTGLGIEQRQDKLRELSRKFVTELTAEDMYLIGKWELEELKASCAYSIAPRNRFPFDVATRHLCAIKARSLGPYKVVTQNFYERFRIHKSFAQRYGRS